MHIACQGGQEGDVLYVFFPVQDGLVEMGHAPPLGNVEAETLGQRFGGRLGGGVAPGAEGCQLVAFPVEGQVAVHHGRNTQGAYGGQGFDVGILVVPGKVAVSVLNTCPHIVQMVGPVAALKAVLPVMGAAGQHGAVRAGQNRLDAGGAELNAQRGGFLFEFFHGITACESLD